MQRAAVVIGVSRTGTLPVLQAVDSCVDEMVDWATDQGFDSVTPLSDARHGEVTIRQVQQAIGACLKPGTVKQLVLYFAGHGVNIGRAEYWLLSGAPEWPNEAVNVASSRVFALQSGVAHVVFVSDACRTAAAADTVFQSVQGSTVFPNVNPTPRKTFVDCFYACALGSPALEVRPAPKLPHRAVYTETLAEALRGEIGSVLETTTSDNGRELGIIRPVPLGDYLADEVARRLDALDPSGESMQNPDAEITSREGAFVARFDPPPGPKRSAGPGSPSRPPSLTAIAREAVHRQLLDGGSAAADVVEGRQVAGAQWFLDQVEFTGTPFGPTRFETHCGIKVRGARVVAVQGSAGAEFEDGSWVRVYPGAPGTTLAMTFDNDTCAVVAALPGFIAALSFDGRELIDLAYEPAANSYRHEEYAGRIEEIRALRGAISVANRVGGFRPDEPDLEVLASRMQFLESFDPTLAVFAAYAYADLGLTERLADMSHYLRDDLQVNLFDVGMLAGHLEASVRTAPPMPMLARGWSLLDAYDARVSEPVAALRRSHLMPSVWTLFDANGTDLAIQAVRRMDELG